jgi:transcriptional regulator with XRE-family HTH domain
MKNFHFGENLRMMRNYRGYTQEAMAKDLSMSQGTYSKIEYSNDLPDIEMINKLAEILSFRPKDLISTSWYADEFNGIVKTNRTIAILNHRGQISYIILLLSAWWDMSRGFIDGAELKSLDSKLLWSAILGLGVFFFYYFSVMRVELKVQNGQFLGEDKEGI